MVVGGAARKDETAIAIAAIDITALIDLKPDSRMTERCTAGNVACPVAGDAAGLDGNGFGLVDHARAFSNRAAPVQPDQR